MRLFSFLSSLVLSQLGIYLLITAGNSLKVFATPAALKPMSWAPRHRPFRQLGGSYFWPCYARRYLPAAISKNLLFVETSADYIITKLLDSMNVNFSKSKHSVGTRFKFYLQWDSFQFYVFSSYVIWECTVSLESGDSGDSFGEKIAKSIV